MNDLILYQEDLEKLNNILIQFIKDSQVVCAFLTNKEGQLLTCQGSTKTIDTMSVAALITGSFAATVTIANLIGESQFSTMFHKGKSKHIHITVIDNDRYLASIFDNHSSLEKVNYYANRYGKKLREYLIIISGNADSASLPNLSDEEMSLEHEVIHDSFESFLDAMETDTDSQENSEEVTSPKRIVLNPQPVPFDEEEKAPPQPAPP
ncbi:MAG: hypothetical protein GF401_01520, partial [Chitinivibrionales bacterium]|nr:hypothetical protein [Chitinivibrionales bacterium]